MTKIIEVKKARKSPGKCGGCQCVIAKGQPYRFVKFFRGPKSVWCIDSKCTPRPSALIGSEFIRAVTEAEEDFTEAIKKRDALKIKAIGERIEELGEGEQEKFDEMPEGLQQGETGQMIEQRSNRCQEISQEIENMADEIIEAEKALANALREVEKSERAHEEDADAPLVPCKGADEIEEMKTAV